MILAYSELELKTWRIIIRVGLLVTFAVPASYPRYIPNFPPIGQSFALGWTWRIFGVPAAQDGVTADHVERCCIIWNDGSGSIIDFEFATVR